ncbi:hypothetical protein [Streptomyces sp. NPDC058256]
MSAAEVVPEIPGGAALATGGLVLSGVPEVPIGGLLTQGTTA